MKHPLKWTWTGQGRRHRRTPVHTGRADHLAIAVHCTPDWIVVCKDPENVNLASDTGESPTVPCNFRREVTDGRRRGAQTECTLRNALPRFVNLILVSGNKCTPTLSYLAC